MDNELLITENLGLVYACANRFKGRGIEYDDLFQSGCLGLVKAANKFDNERGVKFSTYAVPVILGEIKRLFRDGGTVKVGRTLKELSLKAMRATNEFSKKEGRSPSISELAAILGVEEEKACEAVCAAQLPLSLTLFDSESENEGGNQLDLPVESHEERLTDILALRQVIEELDENDKNIIALRFFKNKTQSVTAQELNMTQVQVSRREKKILEVLRKKMTG